MTSGVPIAMYSSGQSKTSLPKPVIFGEGHRIVIAGGEDGEVYIFDRKGGDPKEILKHASDGMVQSIAVGNNAPRMSTY